MKKLFINISLIILVVLPFEIIQFTDYKYTNTRVHASSERRINTYGTTIARKSEYIKRSIKESSANDIGSIAYKMNELEYNYKLPYSWGGDIRDFQKGFDCTGFVHGIMYYKGYDTFLKRFNTHSLYKKLLQDRNFQLVYKSDINSIQEFELTSLKLGDIVMWPSGIMDAKNLPTDNIFGHIGIVSKFIDGVPYITHSVRSDAYNNIDIFPNKGDGINTLKAKTFISLKQRGVLAIFREKVEL
ncbi:MAG: hypothetical protein ACNI3C_00480 [Candidatus Marinarcus sp.]|uniref:hypothetical protein n=1 Tax=Candidatus Marinarcus sp. TaxID=3100987 RepID=UPI003B005EB2